MPKISSLSINPFQQQVQSSQLKPVLDISSPQDIKTLDIDLASTGKKDFVLQLSSEVQVHVQFNMDEVGNREDLMLAIKEQIESNDTASLTHKALFKTFEKVMDIKPLESLELTLEKTDLLLQDVNSSLQLVEKQPSKAELTMLDAMKHARQVIPLAGNLRSEIMDSKGNSLLRSNEQSRGLGEILRATDPITSEEDEVRWKPRLVYNNGLQHLKTDSKSHYADSAFSDVFLRNTLSQKTGGGVCDDFSAVVFSHLLENPPEGVKSMGRMSWAGKTEDIGHSFVVVELENGGTYVVDPWLSDQLLEQKTFMQTMNERGLFGEPGSINQFVYVDKLVDELEDHFPKHYLIKEGGLATQNISGPWTDVLTAKKGIEKMIQGIDEFSSITAPKGNWEQLEFGPEELNAKNAGRKLF